MLLLREFIIEHKIENDCFIIKSMVNNDCKSILNIFVHSPSYENNTTQKDLVIILSDIDFTFKPTTIKDGINKGLQVWRQKEIWINNLTETEYMKYKLEIGNIQEYGYDHMIII